MGYISRYIREHYVKRNIRRDLYERLVRWCGERSVNSCLEKALSILEANIGANIAPNTGAGQPKHATSTSEGYEWCRSKAKVRNLQSLTRWVDEHFSLLDWWEEGDRYCFKTVRKPAKTE